MLTNREIVPKHNLRILLDSDCLNRLLPDGNPQAKVFLKYHDSPFLEFLRTQESTEHLELQKIPEVILQYDEQGELRSLKIFKSDKSARSLYFGYSSTIINQIGTHIFDGQELDEHKIKDLLLVFIQAVLQNHNSSSILSDELADIGILVTDRKILLKNRLWFEGHFPGGVLNIVAYDEAKEIVDLFLKFRKRYYLLPNYQLDKGLYYLCSFRSKVPYFRLSQNQYDAFARRFTFLFMSIDEIGFQYYSCADNNSMDNSVYHFNYFITLTTGIFDSLALHSNDQYKLDFKKGLKISLNSNSGKEFLQKLSKKNQGLRDHIRSNSLFIKLIYQLREEVVHRKLLQQIGFGYKGEDGKWKMNFIKISDEVRNKIKQCKDRKVKYQVVSYWGLYELGPDYFLEPFSFAKAAARNLINFSNTYLELSGSGNFIVESKLKGEHRQFISELETFEQFRLGF